MADNLLRFAQSARIWRPVENVEGDAFKEHV